MSSSINEALDIIASNISAVGSEIISIENALGRIVSSNHVAVYNLPRFNNSAMDGYAVKTADSGQCVKVVKTIYAGDGSQIILHQGNAIKIMTGAPIPKGCEAIVPIENVTIGDQCITLPINIQMNTFIRVSGEDIKKGTTYLHKGEEVNAYSIASLASQGVTHIHVYRIIKIAIFATGDELRQHYETIQAHQLYNSNSPMFVARSKQLGCDVRLIHTAADTLDALQSSINDSLDADIILTSGGASVGDKDFTKEAFSNLGMKTFVNKIDIKPGKPTLIGVLNKTIIINLPGNPLAGMVNYEIFVRAIIRKISGISKHRHATIHTKITHDLKLKGGRFTVLLGIFDGVGFTTIEPQMPGMVSPMQKANACIIVSANIKKIEKESVIKILPISWDFTTEKIENLLND